MFSNKLHRLIEQFVERLGLNQEMNHRKYKLNSAKYKTVLLNCHADKLDYRQSFACVWQVFFGKSLKIPHQFPSDCVRKKDMLEAFYATERVTDATINGG